MSDACTYVIFGATGNLSRVKLLPSLYHLEAAGRLAEGTAIVCAGRRPWDDGAWIDEIRGWIAAKARGGLDTAVFERFARRVRYFRGDITEPATYADLTGLLADGAAFAPNVAFYLSIRPAEFGVVTQSLSEAGLLDEVRGWRRVVIEKPFGYDLPSAQALQKRIARHLREDQVYRIDHYLGKGTV